MAAQPSQPSRQYNNGYTLPNGTPATAPAPTPTAMPPMTQGRVMQAGGSRILCVADVRGNLRSLNDLAKSARADFIIHTGDFGFYDERSLDKIAEKTLKHVIQYSPLVSEDLRRQVLQTPLNTSIKDRIPRNILSQLPLFLNKTFTLDIPVYTVWGACEDVQVLEKLRSGDYKVDNLYIIDEAHSKLLEVGGIKLRLLGLGGAVVMHKLFDNGEGRTTIAGGQGTMWTTLLQMGELVETANRDYEPTETRVLITHASPAREGILNQLCVSLKVDFSISAGLHFRYGSSYNEFSVNPTLDHYRGKLAASKASFNDVWETVRSEVEPAVDENETQKKLLNNALDIVNKMPSVANGGNPFGGHVGPNGGVVDETAFKNMWNFNLADAAFGWLVLEVENGRIGTEMKAQGFNFAHRGMKNPTLQADMIKPSGPSPGIVPSSVPNMAPSVTQTAPPAPITTAAGATSQQRPAVPPTAPVQSPYPGSQQSRHPQQVRQQSVPQHPTSTHTSQVGTPVVAPSTLPPQPPQASSQSLQMQPSTQSQPLQTPKPATPAASTRPIPSPVPQAAAQTSRSTSQQTGPAVAPTTTTATPPAAPTTNGVQKDDSSSEMRNKTSASVAPAGESGASKDSQAPADKKPTDGIYAVNVNSEEDLRNLFSEDDRAKIQRVEKRGVGWIAHFSSPEEAATVLDAVPRDLKVGRAQPGKPNLRPAFDRAPRYDGPGGWNNQARGGIQQGTYRSTGPSDGEAARGGRGSFRGRPRGTDRGDRGRGQPRGGRGRAGPGEGNAGSAGSPSSPAPTAAGGSS